MEPAWLSYSLACVHAPPAVIRAGEITKNNCRKHNPFLGGISNEKEGSVKEMRQSTGNGMKKAARGV